MGDYGVPDEVDGALAWSWAQERLVRNKNYWVVTVSAGGRFASPGAECKIGRIGTVQAAPYIRPLAGRE